MQKILFLTFLFNCLFTLISAQTNNNIIVRFDSKYLNKEVVNDSEINSGEVWEIISEEALNEINNKFSDNTDIGQFSFSKITRLKIADSISISRLGNRIKVPFFWAVLSIKVPEEYDYNDVLFKLKKCNSIIYSHPDFDIVYDNVNDSLFEKQHYLKSSLFPDAHLNVDSAWFLETGKSFVKVGISDTGFDTSHIDLTFKGGAKYGDYFNEEWYNDSKNHGTKCAGVIGAKRNNLIGIAGIAGGSEQEDGVSMYGLSHGWAGNSRAAAASIIEAAYQTAQNTGLATNNSPYTYESIANVGFGVHVLNCSWGLATEVKQEENVDNYELLGYCELCYEAMEFAYRNEVTVVASRGNSNSYTDSSYNFPATFSIREGVISVGGNGFDGFFLTGVNSSESGFSPKIGRGIDIVAPATDSMIVSTSASTAPPFIQNNYQKFNGTSASAPQVTGVVGLMMSSYNVPNCHSQSNLAPEDVEYIVKKTATDVGFSPITPLPGEDIYTGAGRVNAYKALKAIQRPKYQIIHPDNSFISSKTVELLHEDTMICMESKYTNYGPLGGSITLNDGMYNVDVYKVGITYNHSYFTTSPTDSILDVWPRSSSSNGWELRLSSIIFNFPHIVNCQPIQHRPIAYLESYNETEAKLFAYYYHIKSDGFDSTVLYNNWLPTDTSQAKLSYSLYTYDSLRIDDFGFNCDSLTEYDIPTAIEKINNSKLLIYPNPSSGENINIESHQDFDEVNIVNSLGETVLDLKFSTTKNKTISSRDINSGIYLVNIRKKGILITQNKIFIQ